jgi:2-polyprenyl-3-methyl-5-hydroxy-6-metoxy-1,4-benzoquinol methylase
MAQSDDNPQGFENLSKEDWIKYTEPFIETPTNVVDDAPLLETRFKIESIDPDDFGSSENKYDLVTGWEDDVITPNKVFNPDQFTILNEQSIPVFTAKGKEIYQRILSGTATDEDITKFFIYLVTHSPSPAYTFAQFNRPDALADVIKIGIFSDRPLNKILPLGSGLLEKQLFDRLLSRNKNIKQEEIVSIILDIVQENGQFENIRDKMRNVILNAHNDIYNKNPNDYFVLWRGGNLNRTFPWQSMTKRTEAAQDVAQQMNGIYGGGIETSSYVLHKNNFIDLDALGLSHMNEQEVIVFTEAALAKGAKRPTPVNNPDKAKNISEWWLLARESEDMFPKNGVDMTNISQYVDDSGQATQQFFSDVINGIDPRYKPSRPYEPIIEITNDELLSFQKQYNNIVKNGGNFNQHIFTSIPTFYEAQIVKGQALINLLNNAFPTRIFSFEQGLKDGLFDFKLLDIGGTEGSWASTIASLEPRIQVTVLDPNREAKNIFDKNILVNKQFRNAAFTHIKDDFGKYFDETGISFYQEKREYDIVHESMALQFIDADRTGQIEFIKNEVLKPNGILFIEEKFLDNDTIYQANENLKNEFKLQYYTEEQLQNKKFDVLLNMEGKQAAISDVEATLNKNFKHVVQYWDSGNFKGFVASDDEKVLGFVDEINALNTSLTNHRFSTAPTDKEIKYSIQKKITQNGTDPQLAAKIAEETVAQSPQYFNKLSKIAARFGVVGGTALAGLAKLAPALAPGDYAIEKAIEKAVPYLDDAAARLGFARIPFKNLLPTYMAYEIGVAGADIIQAAMYAYDKSQQLPKPSAAAFGSDTFQESLTRLLLPKAYEEEAIKRSQVPGDLLAFYQTPTGKRIVEEMKFGNQFMKELDQEKISKYSPGWGLTKGLLSIVGELAQYEAPEVTLNSSDYTTKLKENPAMIYNAGITGSNK